MTRGWEPSPTTPSGALGLVNRTVLPEIGRALAFSAVRCRMDQVISGVSPRGAEEPIIHLSPYLVPTSSGWTRTGGEPLPLEQVLGDPSFLIPSREDDGGGGRFAAWGCGDYSNLSGGGREGAVNWNGGVLGVHVGADVKLGSNLLAGVVHLPVDGSVRLLRVRRRRGGRRLQPGDDGCPSLSGLVGLARPGYMGDGRSRPRGNPHHRRRRR